ncbi:MAG: FtsW/RodA/SpoVE family cell cycle protein, partial [Emergencia timonensis]
MNLKLKGRQNLRASDFVIVLLVTALVIFGVVMVFSASYYYSINSTGSPYGYLKKQGLFAIAGFVLMAVCTQLDYHLYRRWSIIILIISFLLLGLLLFPGLPFVETINNATRWILIGPITIMPGEIAKIAVIIFTAAFLASEPK